MTGIRRVAIRGLRTRPPFATLFAIDPTTRQAIVVDMRARGFDESKPIDVWDDGGGLVVIDGHTRLDAAKALAMDEVPVYPHVFDEELSALDYAIHNQRDRRNLKGAALVNAIKIRDGLVRQKHGGDRGNQYTGGKLSNDNLPPERRKSGAEVAQALGVSEATVNRARAVYDDPQAMKEVEQGVSIATAADRARARKKGVAVDGGWVELARNGRQDDEPWFIAMNAGSIVQSICARAAREIAEQIAAVEASGFDLAGYAADYPGRATNEGKAVTAWNMALRASRETHGLVKNAILGAKTGRYRNDDD